MEAVRAKLYVTDLASSFPVSVWNADRRTRRAKCLEWPSYCKWQFENGPNVIDA